MKNLIKNAAYWAGMLVLGVALGVTIKIVGAWVEPDQMPPGGNIAAPLNTGNVGQTKLGGLILNTGGSVYGLIVDKGLVGIKTTTPQAELDVNGDIRAHNINLNNNLNVGGDATINGNLNVNGTINGIGAMFGGAFFGEWKTVQFDTVYKAETDGIVIGWGGYGQFTTYTDSNDPPTTMRQPAYCARGYGSHCLINLPVRRGDYWKVKAEGETRDLFFLPILGGGSPSIGEFGDWKTGLEYNKVYKAETDGIIVAKGGYGYLECKTDSDNPPTTIIQTSYAAVGYGSHIQATFPVKKGNYWTITASGLTEGTPEVRFLPLGQ